MLGVLFHALYLAIGVRLCFDRIRHPSRPCAWLSRAPSLDVPGTPSAAVFLLKFALPAFVASTYRKSTLSCGVFDFRIGCWRICVGQCLCTYKSSVIATYVLVVAVCVVLSVVRSYTHYHLLI